MISVKHLWRHNSAAGPVTACGEIQTTQSRGPGLITRSLRLTRKAASSVTCRKCRSSGDYLIATTAATLKAARKGVA